MASKYKIGPGVPYFLQHGSAELPNDGTWNTIYIQYFCVWRNYAKLKVSKENIHFSLSIHSKAVLNWNARDAYISLGTFSAHVSQKWMSAAQ